MSEVSLSKRKFLTTEKTIIFFFLMLYLSSLNILEYDLFSSIIFLFCIISIVLFKDIQLSLPIIMFSLFFMWSLFSSLLSVELLGSFKVVILLGVSTLTCLFILSKRIMDINIIFKIFKVLAYAQTLNVVYTIGVLLTGEVVNYNKELVYKSQLILFPFHIEISGGNPYRIAGLFDNPNSFALYSFISLLFVYFLYKLNELKKITFFTMLILNLVAIYLAFSRTILILFFISIFMLILLNIRTIKLKYFIFMTFFTGILGLILTMYLPKILSWLQNTRLSLDTNGRSIAWDLLIAYIQNNMFIGAGLGQTDKLVLSSLEYGAHNIYLLIFSETGFIGFLLLLLLIIIPFIWSVMQLFKSNEKTQRNFWVLMTIFFAFLGIHQFFENQILRVDLLHYIWVVMLAFAFNGALLRSNKKNIE